jgi:hypothetical protein
MNPLIWWPPLAHVSTLLALAVVCLFRLTQMPPLPDPDAPPAAPAVTATANGTLFVLPDVGVYDGVLAAMDARPLFVAGRRLTDADGTVAPQFDTPTPETWTSAPDIDLRLMAVIGHGATMRALVITPDQDEEVWVQEGDDVAGWQVTTIGPRTLALRLGDRAITFDMFD